MKESGSGRYFTGKILSLQSAIVSIAGLAGILTVQLIAPNNTQFAAAAAAIPDTQMTVPPWEASGTGTHLQVSVASSTESMDSSVAVTATLDSLPHATTISFFPMSVSTSPLITIGGLNPSSVYFVSQDSFKNQTSVTTDALGTISFTEQLDSGPHIVIIKPTHSTTFLRNDATGGDCTTVGTWNASTLTCTLTSDVTGTVEIDDNGIILDGNGHAINGGDYGVFLFNRSGVTIKNTTIAGFTTYGIYSNASSNITASHNIVSTSAANSFSSGLNFSDCNNSTIQNNTISNTSISGIFLSGFSYHDANISGNTLSNNLGSAIDVIKTFSIGGSQNITIDSNTVTNNRSADNTQGVGIGLSSSQNFVITNNDIENNVEGLSISNSFSGSVYHNNIINNTRQLFIFPAFPALVMSQSLPTGGNYWSDYNSPQQGCTDFDSNGICDLPFNIHASLPYDFSFSGIDNFPWVKKDAWKAPTVCVPGSSPTCNDNVLFLPGIEGSRLYQNVSTIGESRVWEPSMQIDATRLYLDQNGDSINPTFTKTDGAIDHAGPPLIGYDVYKTFLQQLTGLVTSNIIAGYKVFPYDWRMSPDDIVNHGTQYNDGLHFPEQALIDLAANSRTGKVTIVAHSTGGLVAKTLMQKLQADGKAGLVDKVILVDVPQLGTPKAIASMLHGDFQNIPGGFGFVVSKANARGLAENMKDAYDLLPSSAYFSNVADPVIDVTEAPDLVTTSALSGPLVTTPTDLQKFLTGAGGRPKPTFTDVEAPNKLDPTLLGQASLLHTSLDTWNPPTGVQVIQVAGWGLDTPKNVTYTEEPRIFCTGLSCASATIIKHTASSTVDGDGTVVTASATAGRPTYFIDLHKYNADKGLNSSHVDITETQPFQTLFSALITSISAVTPIQYITTTQPQSTDAGTRLRLRVLSPVSLDAYDSFGHHTGAASNPVAGSDLQYVEQQIPNSYYEEFGEGKYLGLPADGVYSIKIHGLDTGTFTFIVDSVTGSSVTGTNSYTDIPVTASTIVTVAVGTGAPSNALAVDENGDGVVDVTLASSTQSTDLQSYIKLIKASISGMDMGTSTKRQLTAKFTNVGYMIARLDKDKWEDDDDDGRDINKTDKLTQRILKKLDKIDAYINKQFAKTKPGKSERISAVQAQAILNMNAHLKSLIIIKQPS